MDDVVTLVKESFSQNENMEYISSESERTVFCTVKSVNRTEYFNAGANGLNPSFVFVMPCINYDNENLIKYNGVRYSVYRTFLDATSNMIELYVEVKP